MSATCSKTNKEEILKESTDSVITFCLTWQEVRAPVYIWETEGRGSDDLSRFRSHKTENLLVHADKCLGINSHVVNVGVLTQW